MNVFYQKEMRLLRKQSPELSLDEAGNLLELFDSVWPSSKANTVSRSKRVQKMQLTWQDQKSTSTFILLKGAIIAHARVFPRSIIFEGRLFEIMALASVCVKEKFRGQGIGRKIFQNIFIPGERNDLPVALFQTAVPQFYKKLGAKIVMNRFINSSHKNQPQQNPWWDPYVMIYPASSFWPEASITVDLNGPGY